MTNEDTLTRKKNWWNWRYWRNLGIFTFCVVLIAAVAGAVRLSYQAAMNYVQPLRIELPADYNPARFGADYREIKLRTRDNVELSAWHSAAKNGALILIAHGYRAVRPAALHAIFARHGYGVISWDARAHGASGGDTTTLGYREALDVEAALDYALGQNGVRHIGAYGQSMGAATVIRTAARRGEIKAVVADSAYPALEEMIDRVVRFRPLRPLVRFFGERAAGMEVDAMRPVDDIGRISPRPVFIIQGGNDDTIPADSARRLYQAAGEPRTLWIADGAVHGGARAVRSEEYDRRLLEFFDANLVAK